MDASIRYQFIDQPGALRSALADLASGTSLALDFEMENSYHHYGLHIALIQLSTPEQKNYIVDPLAGMDIHPLGALLTHRNTELILHDADFDQRACAQVYGWKLNHLFDTKVAAQLCGFRQFGLGHLLKALLHIQVDKKFQTFNWLKRPIRQDALDYAARDTASLHALKAILTRRLIERGRLAWAQEEFLRLEHLDLSEPASPAHYRMKRSSLLSPRQLAILRALSVFRDQIARRLNRPVHYVMRDPILLQFAIHPPANEAALRRVSGLHPVMYRKETLQQFLQTVEAGQKGPEDLHPLRKKRPAAKAGTTQRLKAMQDWRRQAAVPFDLEPHLLLSNDILHWCARHSDEPLPPPVAAQLRHWQQALLWEEFQQKFITSPGHPS